MKRYHHCYGDLIPWETGAWVKHEDVEAQLNEIRALQRPTEVVLFMSQLHTIVARRCPKNVVGQPVVSDFDKLTATETEMREALDFVKSKRKENT